MKRLVVIAAAGKGRRLCTSGPKVLYPVNGRPMLCYLTDLYLPFSEQLIVVVHPSALEAVQSYCHPLGARIQIAVQETPMGMLDAVLAASAAVAASAVQQVWVTWCDQIAICRATLHRLVDLMESCPLNGLVIPTVRRTAPYIHLVRDARCRIVGALQRREGDSMPSEGESDIGLFGLTRDAYLRLLPEYALSCGTGRMSCERNFIPFIPWAAARTAVRTFDAGDAMQSVGVNEPRDAELLGPCLKNTGGGTCGSMHYV